MSTPRLELTRTRILARARLQVVLSGLSEVHFGEPGQGWGGDAHEGWYVFDNGSGDRLALAWDRSGLVGLAFAHESERSQRREPEANDPRTRLPGLPASLDHLAETAASSLDGATAGLWIEGDGPAHLSDPIESTTRWAHGAEMFVRFGMEAHDAVFGAVGQSWLELSSLSRAQAELACRLAEQSERGPVTLDAAAAELIVASPEPDEPPTLTLEWAAGARDTLAQLGIAWELPVATIDAIVAAAAAERRARIRAALPPEHRRILDAARAGDLETLRACIDAGLDLEARTVDEQYEYTPVGDTPLLQALKARHRDCAALLLHAGARHDSANAFGQTALHWAVRTGDVDATRLLLEAGAAPSGSDTNGWTPLHWAAAEGYDALVELLLQSGADPTAVHRGGLAPADVADRRERPHLAARLRTQA